MRKLDACLSLIPMFYICFSYPSNISRIHFLFPFWAAVLVQALIIYQPSHHGGLCLGPSPPSSSQHCAGECLSVRDLQDKWKPIILNKGPFRTGPRWFVVPCCLLHLYTHCCPPRPRSCSPSVPHHLPPRVSSGCLCFSQVHSLPQLL